MEYDIENILTMYEDDYNPSSKVPGPRNMYAGGQLVRNTVDGSRPGYSGLGKDYKGKADFITIDGAKYRKISAKKESFYG